MWLQWHSISLNLIRITVWSCLFTLQSRHWQESGTTWILQTEQERSRHGTFSTFLISLLLPKPLEPWKSKIHQKYQISLWYSKEKYTVSWFNITGMCGFDSSTVQRPFQPAKIISFRQMQRDSKGKWWEDRFEWTFQ